MKNWTLKDRGFLPDPDPLERVYGFDVIEDLASIMPAYVDRQSFRLNARAELRNFNINSLYALLETDNPRAAERLFMLFCYFASAYVHTEEPTNIIPRQIAQPLVLLAYYLDRHPILSYASYCLNNWKRTDPEKPIELGNIELLQNFSHKTKRDEDWFILVHVEIEAHAAKAIKALYDNLLTKNLDQTLTDVADSMIAMNKTLARMPENCDPEVYFSHVRPYIFGFNDVIYDGCFDNNPKSLRGETGAQSTIIPYLLRELGIQHRNSLLTKHLDDMISYMPKEHAAMLGPVKISLKDQLWTNERKALYNECIHQLVTFRTKHLEYAVNYIEKKVDNPLGTGGTPYITWLKQLIDETKEYYIR